MDERAKSSSVEDACRSWVKRRSLMSCRPVSTPSVRISLLSGRGDFRLSVSIKGYILPTEVRSRVHGRTLPCTPWAFRNPRKLCKQNDARRRRFSLKMRMESDATPAPAPGVAVAGDERIAVDGEIAVRHRQRAVDGDAAVCCPMCVLPCPVPPSAPELVSFPFLTEYSALAESRCRKTSYRGVALSPDRCVPHRFPQSSF